uniref:Uncharacterized protein n=1 Tax=Myotis myotis TaxID=51298 RepID=A0A7J8AL71_MYOMY|nr:hypothetical protein mMyoMyo1_007808 [Myotis myotis]
MCRAQQPRDADFVSTLQRRPRRRAGRVGSQFVRGTGTRVRPPVYRRLHPDGAAARGEGRAAVTEAGASSERSGWGGRSRATCSWKGVVREGSLGAVRPSLAGVPNRKCHSAGGGVTPAAVRRGPGAGLLLRGASVRRGLEGQGEPGKPPGPTPFSPWTGTWPGSAAQRWLRCPGKECAPCAGVCQLERERAEGEPRGTLQALRVRGSSRSRTECCLAPAENSSTLTEYAQTRPLQASRW